MSNITQSHTVTLVKPSYRNLNDAVISKNATAMVNSVSNKSLRARGWDVEFTGHSSVDSTEENRNYYGIEEASVYIFTMTLEVTYNYHAEPIKGDLAGIVRKLASKSQTPAYGSWTVSLLNGNPYEMPADHEVAVDDAAELVGYAEISAIPEDWDSHFSHLYGLDAHIRRVRRAIEAGINSGWKKRLSVVLVGDPGCGKSDIAESVMRALGGEACWRLDATATTAAGTIKELSELEILPRIVVIEEAEKANEKVTEPFLGILDKRGEVNKTTARGKVQRDARLLAISTVNDYEKFKRMNAGALESRHTVKVFFKRPNRDTLTLILTREVHEVNGDVAWIAPTLDYCEKHGITDPREVISHMLSGAADWLKLDENGVSLYEADLDATSQAEADED